MAIQEHLWEFPHDMQLKVMGLTDSPLETAVIEILEMHLEDFDADKHLASKPSSKGNFVSITAQVTMRNRTLPPAHSADVRHMHASTRVRTCMRTRMHKCMRAHMAPPSLLSAAAGC